MAEKPKRLKKNISFSEHERDIYDYLDGVKNASALIKRLVYNHMIMEKGLVAPVIVTAPLENSSPEVTQGTPKESKKPEEPKDKEPEVKQPELTPEELENQRIAQELDL